VAGELVRTWLAAALDACAYADGSGARVDAGASKAHAYATDERVVRWSRCERGR
jgi:hypothetical protein